MSRSEWNTNAERNEKIVAAYHAGKSAKQTSLLVGCSRNAVLGVWDRKGLTRKLVGNGRTGGEFINAVSKPSRDPSPPSPAMIRLAQFDSVIRRALAERRGEAFEPPLGVTSTGVAATYAKKRGDY